MKTKVKKIWEKFIRNIKKKIKNIDKKDIIIFLIPLIMFGIYWIIFYPGILSYDSYNQLQQIEAMSFTPAHPFFHTFIEMILMKIWNTPAVVGLFQILVFCILWTSICKYNRKTNSKQIFFAQALITFLIALSPLNKTLSITLWKDVLYSYAVLWLCFELQKLLDKKFKIKWGNLLKLSFILLLLPNLRHNGYIITVLIGIIIFIMLIKKDKKSKNYLKLIGFSLIFFFAFKGIEKIYSVNYENSMSASTAGSIVDYKLLSIIGEIGKTEKFDDASKEEISEYVNYDKLVKYSYYNMLDRIWIFCEPDLQAISDNKVSFYKMVGGFILKKPYPFISYAIKETSFIWRIIRYDDSWGIINYLGIKSNNTDKPYTRPFENSKIYEIAYKYVTFTRENKMFQTILYSGSLCLYLSIAIIVYLKKKHKINNLLVFLPIIFNLIGLILTMPVNDIRYYYSNFLVLYLLIIIFANYWVKE